MRPRTLYLLAIILLVYPILQLLLGLDLSWQVGQIEIQFFTSIFAHGSLGHLLGNSFSLLLFGLILEGYAGPKKLLITIFAAALVGNLAAIGSYNSVLGLSGGIYGLIGVLTVLRPTMLMWVAGMPMPMFLAGIGYALYDLFGAVANASNTGHLAHLAGLAVGVLLGFYWREPKTRTKVQKVEEAHLDHALDQYEKIYFR